MDAIDIHRRTIWRESGSGERHRYTIVKRRNPPTEPVWVAGRPGGDQILCYNCKEYGNHLARNCPLLKDKKDPRSDPTSGSNFEDTTASEIDEEGGYDEKIILDREESKRMKSVANKRRIPVGEIQICEGTTPPFPNSPETEFNGPPPLHPPKKNQDLQIPQDAVDRDWLALGDFSRLQPRA